MRIDPKNYKACAAYLNAEMPDEAMRLFLFGAKELGHRDLGGVGAVAKLIRVQFVLIYAKWLSCGRNALARYQSVHAVNVFRLLFRLYKQQRLDLDVMIYTLSEAQKDVAEQRESSFFSDICCDSACPYGKIYGLIDGWQRSLQGREEDKETVFNYFVAVLNNAVWISDIKRLDKENTFLLGEKALPARDFIYTDPSGIPCLLVDKICMSNKTHYEYVTLDGLRTVQVIGDKEAI